uniref:Uncharacterized protein n=1 Tax=Meloidogyne hapla TaxID=6305 RepID=A0A1I8BQM3_MELHA
MFSAFQRPLPYSYTILIVTCFCCMANIKFTDGTTRNKRSPPTLGGEFVKRLVTIPMVAGGVALTDKFKGEKRAKQVEGMKNESKKDMSNFYKIYAKRLANRKLHKQVGINPQFWKKIAKNEEEKKMKKEE